MPLQNGGQHDWRERGPVSRSESFRESPIRGSAPISAGWASTLRSQGITHSQNLLPAGRRMALRPFARELIA